METDWLSRTTALLGEGAKARLADASVVVIGVGGVGSWCAEALVRTGLGHITLMDDDVVAPSNINRQCPATSKTVGQLKVEAMKARLLEINPEVEVTALATRYEGGALPPCDAVIDAIDSVDCKAQLLLAASDANLPVFSSMGAALRFDPTQVVLTRFDKVAGDGLAKALRNRFRKLGRSPRPFLCVWSKEAPRSCPIRGSLMPVTATFGLVLASAVLNNFLPQKD